MGTRATAEGEGQAMSEQEQKPERIRARTARSPATLKRKRRIIEALDYREQGHSYAKIAAEMRISKSTAHGLIEAAMAELTDAIREKAIAVRELELRRLDIVQVGIFSRACSGHIPSLEIFLRIHDRRVALMGLIRKPVETVEVVGNTGPVPVFEFARSMPPMLPPDPALEEMRAALGESGHEWPISGLSQ